jgi:hypothetical protein
MTWTDRLQNFFKGDSPKPEFRFWEVVAMVAYALGAWAIYLYARDAKAPYLVFSTLFLVGSAAWLSGAVLGFLFGVPRLRAGEGARIDPDAQFVPNTNLEQISDWLTKIIIGATLVQLGTLVDRIGWLAERIGSELQTPAAASVSGAVMVFYFATGFIWGYLWCSLRIFKEMTNLVGREKTVRAAESGA